MDAAASVLLLEPDGNLHNNGTNKRTLKAFLGVLVYCWTGFRKDVLVRHDAGRRGRGRGAVGSSRTNGKAWLAKRKTSPVHPPLSSAFILQMLQPEILQMNLPTPPPGNLIFCTSCYIVFSQCLKSNCL